MEAYKAANPGSSVSPLNVPYAGLLGANLRFRIEFFMLKLGFHYIEAFLYSSMGSIEPPASRRNTVRFNTRQIALPLTACFLLEASRRCIFYFGGGFSVFFAHLEITQGRPDPALGLPDSAKKRSFDTHLFGYHLCLGVEFPLILKRLSISAEWMFQQGISQPVRASGGGARRTIDVTGNHLIFGLNYYFTIGKTP
jgi:hypothetical protein